MFNVVASDLDGTLLTPQHQLSNLTKTILQAIRKQDVHFVFSTGRHYKDVSRMRDKMEIDAFMITSNGARIHDHNNNLLFSQNINPLLATELAQICKNDPYIYTHIFQDDNWLINRDDDYSLSFFRDTEFTYEIFNPANIKTENISKIYFTVSDHAHNGRLIALKKKLDAIYQNKLSIAFSTLNCLEVMDEGVSKGQALKIVAERLGFTLSNCIAFGDGMNDFEMLKMAGKGCIMENASLDLINKLPNLEIIGSNVDDAVPHYLKQLFLKD